MPIDQSVSTGNEWESRFGYSRAVRAGNLIFTTGTVSMNPDGSPYTPEGPGAAGAQAARCLQIIGEAVEQLGGRVTDIVRTRFYVTDISRSEEFGLAHGAFFGGAGSRPCLTMVEVARLIAPEFLIEIEAEAVVG
ncbi:MAG: enamine deaminase RidA (YjgF/YER057c/UK114 family) [Phycisphaerales bacterium]|jgi:enamine deaminase RidA (YjgF/YER057c/UK114 family)